MNERKLTIGTNYFTSRFNADRYYIAYGLDSNGVQGKLDRGEIHIGTPPFKAGEILATNSDGRYTITS